MVRYGYTISSPDKYVAITGFGIKGNVKIAKSGMIWPLQRAQKFSIQPRDYSMNLQAMTKEKLQFLLPVVFTIGPDVNRRGVNAPDAKDRGVVTAPGKKRYDDETTPESQDVDLAAIVAEAPTDGGDALLKYAMLLAESDKKTQDPNARNNHIEDIVKGIIEGETRVLVSSMTMEEIFSQRELFKKRILTGISTELAQFGLKIYNANVKELRDAPNSNYFDSLSKKAHEGAINQAKVDVAEAQMKGTVGSKTKEGEQERQLAKIQAETQVQKTQRDSERAAAEGTLAQNKIKYKLQTDIARIQAERETEIRNEELSQKVESARALTEMERLRASDVVQATILREAKEQEALATKFQLSAEADASQYVETKNADAHVYSMKAEADTTLRIKQQTMEFDSAARMRVANDAAARIEIEANALLTKAKADAQALLAKANADAETAKMMAEAKSYAQQKEAEGLTAMASAYSHLSHALGGPDGLIKYLMIKEGTYQQLATANAEAIRGLNPKMTIWNTGSNAGSEGSGSGMGGADSIRNVAQMLPPLMTTIHEQTGMTFPEWAYGKVGQKLSEGDESGKRVQMTNGH